MCDVRQEYLESLKREMELKLRQMQNAAQEYERAVQLLRECAR